MLSIDFSMDWHTWRECALSGSLCLYSLRWGFLPIVSSGNWQKWFGLYLCNGRRNVSVRREYRKRYNYRDIFYNWYEWPCLLL